MPAGDAAAKPGGFGEHALVEPEATGFVFMPGGPVSSLGHELSGAGVEPAGGEAHRSRNLRGEGHDPAANAGDPKGDGGEAEYHPGPVAGCYPQGQGPAGSQGQADGGGGEQAKGELYSAQGWEAFPQGQCPVEQLRIAGQCVRRRPKPTVRLLNRSARRMVDGRCRRAARLCPRGVAARARQRARPGTTPPATGRPAAGLGTGRAMDRGRSGGDQPENPAFAGYAPGAPRRTHGSRAKSGTSCGSSRPSL